MLRGVECRGVLIAKKQNQRAGGVTLGKNVKILSEKKQEG